LADRYWVGGTAIWDNVAGTKWATTSGGAGGASVPGANDQVFFTAASTGVCTIPANVIVQGFNTTGFTGTITGTGGIECRGSNSIDNVGNFILGSGTTFTNTGQISFTSIRAHTITLNGKTVGSILYNGSTPGLNFGSAVTCAGTFHISNGNLMTHGYNLTARNVLTTGTGAKNLNIINTTWTITTADPTEGIVFTGAKPTLNDGTPFTNFVFTGGASRLDTLGAFNSSVIGTQVIGNLTYTSAGGGVRTIGAGQAFRGFSAASTGSTIAGLPVEFVLEGNFTGPGTIGTTPTIWHRRTIVRSNIPGVQRMWSGGGLTFNHVDFRDITTTNTPDAKVTMGDMGGNSIADFRAGRTVFFRLSGATSVTTDNAWALTSNGTPLTEYYPLPQDSVSFPNVGSTTTTLTIPRRFCVTNFTTALRSNALTLTAGGGFRLLGNLTFNNQVTSTGVEGPVYLEGYQTTQTITPSGKSLHSLDLSTAYNTSVSLGGALTLTGDPGVANTGVATSFDANDFTITTVRYIASAGNGTSLGSAGWTITGTGTVWQQGTGTLSGTATITLTNNTTAERTFVTGAKTYSGLVVGGATGSSTLNIVDSAGTFGLLRSIKTVAHTIKFPALLTYIGSWEVSGKPGEVVTVSRTGDTGSVTLQNTSGGVFTSKYIAVDNITGAPGSNRWVAIKSTATGSVIGWQFMDTGGEFFSFF
jgi:hypothetical protein